MYGEVLFQHFRDISFVSTNVAAGAWQDAAAPTSDRFMTGEVWIGRNQIDADNLLPCKGMVACWIGWQEGEIKATSPFQVKKNPARYIMNITSIISSRSHFVHRYCFAFSNYPLYL